MTYCVAIKVAEGVVFVSDSRTNAGVDQVSVYSKMHLFGEDDDRTVVLLTSGNLATTQAVLRRIRTDQADARDRSLATARSMAEGSSVPRRRGSASLRYRSPRTAAASVIGLA